MKKSKKENLFETQTNFSLFYLWIAIAPGGGGKSKNFTGPQ